MGSMIGLSPLTYEDIKKEIDQTQVMIPMTDISPDGAIIVNGIGGIFSVKPVRNVAWFKNKMTMDEYVQIINYLNEAVTQSMIGESKMYRHSDALRRTNKKFNAIEAAVVQLNELWNLKGVTFAFGSGELKSHVVGHHRHHAHSVHIQECKLYIQIN